MINILTSISLEKTIQSSLQQDKKKARKKRTIHTLESAKQHIESFGYKLTSTQYVSVIEKLDIACPLGHRYSVSYSSFQRGYRCAECAGLKKHTIEAVKRYIESFKGYRLLSTQYVSAKEKLDISCPAGHLYKVRYSSFQSGSRCLECAGLKKHTIEAVKRYIESFAYKLISTQYVNSVTSLEISCPKNHTYFGTYNKFQRGNRCAECRKHTFESVKQHIESFKGYRLLSTTYEGANEKLKIVCPKGHSYKASFHVFQQGHRCAECAGNKKHTIEAVKQHIESFGYKVISTEYLGNHENLEIICPNQHMYKVTHGNFKKGYRCAECDDISKRRTMSNGEDWKPHRRKSRADIFWTKKVKERDGQTCQACFYPSKKLCAHHIESFALNPDLQTDINNGVTLCEPCHIEIHSKYGQTTATRSDLEEFIRFKCS